MSLHSDTLSWFRSNQSLLFLLGHHHHLINLVSPWYSYKIAELALKNNRSIKLLRTVFIFPRQCTYIGFILQCCDSTVNTDWHCWGCWIFALCQLWSVHRSSLVWHLFCLYLRILYITASFITYCLRFWPRYSFSGFTIESQDNIPDCIKTHIIKTALPISLPGVKETLFSLADVLSGSTRDSSSFFHHSPSKTDVSWNRLT
jgi:hypothetical protein